MKLNEQSFSSPLFNICPFRILWVFYDNKLLFSLCSNKYWYSTWNFCIKRLVLLFSNFSSSYRTYNIFAKIYKNWVNITPNTLHEIDISFLDIILLFAFDEFYHSFSSTQQKIDQNLFFQYLSNIVQNKNYSKTNVMFLNDTVRIIEHLSRTPITTLESKWRGD